MPANRSFCAQFAAYRAKVIINEAFGKRSGQAFGQGQFDQCLGRHDSWAHGNTAEKTASQAKRHDPIIFGYFDDFWEIPARLVRMKGLEPSLRLKNSDLNAARLPIPPHPH